MTEPRYDRAYGEQVWVHRKGATYAAAGVLGIIPGSMATPGFLVRGLGQPDSLHSASHGAGRVMSRSEARGKVEEYLREHDTDGRQADNRRQHYHAH